MLYSVLLAICFLMPIVSGLDAANALHVGWKGYVISAIVGCIVGVSFVTLIRRCANTVPISPFWVTWQPRLVFGLLLICIIGAAYVGRMLVASVISVGQ